MSQLLRQGWGITKAHFKLVIVLFVYHAVWGFMLYRIVNHIVTPILKRYPDASAGSNAIVLFWTENQFQLLKTDLIRPYLYAFLIILFLRMLITPFLQAGLLHSIHHHTIQGGGTFFLKGIKTKWKMVTLLYWIKNVATIVPIIFYMQPILRKLLTNPSLESLMNELNWSFVAVIIWALLIQTLFYFLQLGAAWEMSILTILKKAIVHALALCGVTMMIFLLSLAISTGVHLLSLLWVSLISFIIYQALPFFRIMMKIWLISTQYKAIESE